MNRFFQNGLSALAVGLSLLASAAALAQSAHGEHNHTAASAPAAAEMTLGEVPKVDLAQGKLTIRHEEIKNLQMPPMTMVFGVVPSALPSGLKVGDKIRFRATQEAGQYRVTELQTAP